MKANTSLFPKGDRRRSNFIEKTESYEGECIFIYVNVVYSISRKLCQKEPQPITCAVILTSLIYSS